MPTCHLELREGRSLKQKKERGAKAARITGANAGTLPEAPGAIITAIARENRAQGGPL